MFLVYYLSVGVVGKLTISLNEKIINLLGSTTNTLLNNIGIANWLNSLIVDGIISGVGSIGYIVYMYFDFRNNRIHVKNCIIA